MARKLFLSLFIGILLLPAFNPVPAATTPGTEYVYICNGPASKVYHRSPDCKGLSHCSTAVEKVTLAAAQKKGRRPCKIEY